MEFIFAGLANLVIAYFGYLLYRADKRFDEAQAAWRLERVALLNRIQHPDAIPTEDMPEPTGELLHVPYDDDDAHEKYMEARRAGEVR